MKRKISLWMVLFMCLVCTPCFAHDFEVNGIFYNILSQDEKTVAVTYYGTYSGDKYHKYSENIIIPQTVAYYSTYRVTSIGESAFEGCKDLTSISIPNSVTSIGDYAFQDCAGLTNIEIPNSVTSIGVWAFRDCAGLTNIEIPNSVTSIGGSAFYNTAWYNNQPDGLIYAGKVAYEYKGTMPRNTSIVLDEGTIRIGNGAFSGGTGLTSIEIPSSMTSIGFGAFIGCTGLTGIEIPNSVTSIGDYAFSRCTGRSNIEIPNSVTSIGSEAFEQTTWYINQPKGLVYAGKVAYKYKRAMPQNTSIVLEEGTIGIGRSAFNGCTRLTSISIPNSVTSIGGWAFHDCRGLTNIEIPNSVTNIGMSAFQGCTGLTSIVIPNSVTYIGQYAFEIYGGLTSIVVATGNSAYDSRNNCNAIIESASNTLIAGCNSTIIPSNVTSIGDRAFYQCNGLKTITIPSNVTSIGRYAFSSCSELTNMTIGNKVKSIGDYAFSYCRELRSATIGESVAKIGERAFYSCPLLRINNYADFPPICGSEAFGYNKSNRTLYVKPQSVDYYYTHKDWCDFYIEPMTEEMLAIESVVRDDAASAKNYLDLTGQMLAQPRKGEIYVNGGRKAVIR